jgi:very-short-patch-repair endonuclease
MLKRGGIATSHVALALHDMIGRGIHNYKYRLNKKRVYLDIAFVLNNCKVCVEYNGYVWHKNKLDKDKKRLRQLVNRGWKVLIVKGNRLLPTQQQLDSAIQDLTTTTRKQVTITLADWGLGEFPYAK